MELLQVTDKMAGKPLTYAQQVQELKGEKQALIEENERLRSGIESEEALRNEIADLEAKIAAQSNVDNQGNIGLQGKLNDANQRANEEAANAKRLRSQIETITRANQVLEDGLQRFKDAAELVAHRDGEIAQLRAEMGARTTAYLRKERQSQDTLVAVNNELNTQTNELRNLRLSREANEKLIKQLQEDTTEKLITFARQHEIDEVRIAQLTEDRNRVAQELLRTRKEATERIQGLESGADKRNQVVNALTKERDELARIVEQFRNALNDEANNLVHLKEIIG